MKKLIYIIALFVSTFAFSQISGKLIPDGSIPSAKIEGGSGSATVIDNVTSTSTTSALSANQGKVLKDLIDGIEVGTGNINVIVPTSVTDLTSNSNKYIYLQTTLTLTSNTTLGANLIFIDGGGKIVLNGYTLTGNNTFRPNDLFIDAYTGTLAGTWFSPDTFNLDKLGAKAGGITIFNGLSIAAGSNIVTSSSYTFTSSDIGKKCAIVGAGTAGKVHNATITAVSPNVTLSANAITTVSNKNGTVSWDNRIAVQNALVLLNQSGGSTLTGDNKLYYHSTIAKEAQDYNDPVNWAINGDNHTLKNVSFQLIPHDLTESETLLVDKATNTTLNNVKLYGDRFIHGAEGVGKTEGNHGFTWRTLAKNTIMNNCTAANFYGDGGIARGDMQFTNYIDGSAGITGNTASTVSVGTIEDDGLTIDTGATDKIYTPSFIDIDKSQFTNQIQTGYPNKSYKLGGRSNAGWGGLRTPYYRAFYYNEAKTTLLYSSPIQYLYDEIPLKEEWKFVRFVFDAPIDITLVELMAAPQMVANGLIWTGGEIYGNGRDGVSNPPDNATFDGIYFHDNGYLIAGPNYNFNAEDRRRYCRNLTIQNCKFRDAFGDIKLVGTENVLIKNNVFLPHTRQVLAIERDYEYFGLDIAYGRNTIVEGNIVYERANDFDRGDFIHGNKFIGGRIAFSANSNEFKDNYCENIYFKGNTSPDVNRVGYPSMLSNNKFIYNKEIPNSTYLFIDPNKTMAFVNNEFRFNDISKFSFDTTQTDFMVFDSGGKNRIFQNTTPTTDFGGYWEGNRFFGATPDSDYDVGYVTPPIKDFNNNTIETSVSFKNDLVGSYTIKNNIIEGFLYLELDNFPSTVTGTPETLRFENQTIIIDGKYAWTNTGAGILKTETRYVNLEFINCTFDIQVTSTDVGYYKKWIILKQLGTALFENCTFKSKSAKAWTFTDLNVGVGDITLKNNKFDNVTTVLRAGDRMKYSYPDVNCPTYASNALALAALGAGYYYKDSADTNKYKITY